VKGEGEARFWRDMIMVTLEKTLSVSKHRDRLDIIADILNAANGKGVRKTYLMYKCNLSFKQLKNYLGFLLQKELLKQVIAHKSGGVTLFQITPKGQTFLKTYKNLQNFLTTS